MHPAAAPVVDPQEIPQVQLKADAEKQQEYPEVGQVVEDFTALHADGIEDKTRQQVTDQTGQTDLSDQQAESEGQGNPYRFHAAYSNRAQTKPV